VIINELIKKQLEKRKDFIIFLNGEEITVPQLEEKEFDSVLLDIGKKVIQIDNLDFSKNYKFTISKVCTQTSNFNNVYNKGIPAPDTTLYGTIQYKVPNYTYIYGSTRVGVQWIGWLADKDFIEIKEY
jgi:hypothetical protein